MVRIGVKGCRDLGKGQKGFLVGMVESAAAMETSQLTGFFLYPGSTSGSPTSLQCDWD